MELHLCPKCNTKLEFTFNLVCHACHPHLADCCRATDEFIDRQIAEQLAELHCKMRQDATKSDY